MQRLRELVDGRSVALVGNSSTILRERPAEQIDAHDVVIRMNLGIPGKIPEAAIGRKTTVLTLGRFWGSTLHVEGVELYLWMKLTELGQEQLRHFLNAKPKAPVSVWPGELEIEVEEYVGAPPSTGVRLLYWLRRYANPASISTFGLDGWASSKRSHWSNSTFTWGHNKKLEQEALKRLMP